MATSSGQAVLRTQAPSLIGSLYLATPFSAFVPQGPAKSKGHVREYVSQIPRSGNAVAGGQPRFEIQRDVDVVTMGLFRFSLAAIAVANWGAGATFSRYVDMVGLAALPQIVVRSGTQQLQLIKPLESLIAILKLTSNEHRRNILRLIGQGTPAERDARALAVQEITVPFLTTLGLNLHGDMSQSLYVRGLNDFLTFEASLAPQNELIESDAVLPSFPTTGSQPFVPNSLELVTEGYHLTKKERAMIATYYKEHAFSIHFKDQQYATSILPGGVGNGATALPFTASDLISNINQPVQALFIICRWVADLTRVCGGTGGTRGRNIFNIAGWWNPGGGATNELLDTVAIRSGNVDILKETKARRLVEFSHERDFVGDMGAAIMAASYSHDVSMSNACLGFISFDQIEQPRLLTAWRIPTLGTAHATLNAAATADIGQNSDIQLDVIGFTAMQLDIANFLMSRPWN